MSSSIVLQFNETYPQEDSILNAHRKMVHKPEENLFLVFYEPFTQFQLD